MAPEVLPEAADEAAPEAAPDVVADASPPAIPEGTVPAETQSMRVCVQGQDADLQVKLAPHFELIALPIVPSATDEFLALTSA